MCLCVCVFVCMCVCVYAVYVYAVYVCVDVSVCIQGCMWHGIWDMGYEIWDKWRETGYCILYTVYLIGVLVWAHCILYTCRSV
jgi:hypothetical protein